MTTNNTGTKAIIDNGEFYFGAFIKALKCKRSFVLKIVSGSFLFGTLIVLFTRVEFTATCKLMPETQEGNLPNLGGLGGLAGLAGFDIGNITNDGALTPELYPEIVSSISFQLDLINQEITFEKQDTTSTSFVYFKEIQSPSVIETLTEYTIGLPFKLKNWLTSTDSVSNQDYNNLIWLSKEDSKLIRKFQERIEVSVDTKTGIIAIAAEMPDALAAAELGDAVVNLLTSKVTDYKLGKAKSNLDFVQDRFDEAKLEFEEKQKELALSTDRNRNVSTALAQIEIQRIENEYNIAFEVYKGLATQLEQAKIQVKEQTPIFTVLEPIQIPVEKSQPKTLIILLAMILLGFVIACGWIVADDYILRNLKENS